MIDPNKDGVDHINIYSMGKTNLGKYLSNFAFYNFTFEEQNFASVEHWWYYQLTGHQDCLSSSFFLSGKVVKNPSLIKKQMKQYIKDNNITPKEIDRNKLKQIYIDKILKNQTHLLYFLLTDLPFKHYYVFGGKVVEAHEQFLVDIWSEIKIELKQNLPILLNKGYKISRGMFIPTTEDKYSVESYNNLKNEIINQKVNSYIDDLLGNNNQVVKLDPFNEEW